MKFFIAPFLAVCMLSTPVWAHDAHSDQLPPSQAAIKLIELDSHAQEDLERHRAMAHAHAQAAQCLAAGKPYDDCQKQLKIDCKGLALGKNCGMRHAH